MYARYSDGTRPVCTPCRKRDRELLCQYSLDSKTASGAPSKGYVHHLELKLRELQSEKTPKDSPPSTSFTPNHVQPQQRQGDVWQQQPPPPTLHRQNSLGGHRPKLLPPLAEITEGEGAPGNTWKSHNIHTARPDLQSRSNGPSPSQAFLPPFQAPQPPSWGAHQGQTPDPVNDEGEYQSSGSQLFTRQITLAIDRKLGTRSEPMVSGPRPTASVNHRKKSISVDCALPPLEQSDYFVTVYWTLVHPMFPVLDREAFDKAYLDIRAGTSPGDLEDPLMIVVINLVLGLGCQHSDSFEMDSRDGTAKAFFDRGTELLNLELMDTGSLETVQCFLLMTQYLQSTKTLSRCWMIAGIAVRMAQAIGLHRPEISDRQMPKRRELYRRVWHACLFMDRVFSMTFDRPPMMERHAMTQVPLPMAVDEEFLPGPQPPDRPSEMEYWVKSLQLIKIMDEMLQDNRYVERDHKTPDDQYELLFGHPENSEVFSVLKHDRILMAFSRRLPSHLQLYTSESRSSELFMRQTNVLRARYLHCRILLFRPVLSRFCLAQNDLTFSSAPKIDESLPQRLALAASTLCVRAAHENIDLIYTNLGQQRHALASLPASWFCVLYLYSAATVLQAARLRPIVEMGVSDYGIDTSWTHALEALNRLTRVNTIAKRCLAALEILSDKVSDSNRSGGPSRAEPASAPGLMETHSQQQDVGHGQSKVGPSGFPPPPPRRDSSEHWSAADGRQGGEVPLGRQNMDLDGFDFDIGDMTWLTTTRILTWM
ncbi:MAG: hypothetical protein Q9227_008569 [Pyrenula ochraceoflavens]